MRIFISFVGFLIFPLLVLAYSANNFQLTSIAFENNSVIPKKYTCDGKDVNPPLIFNNLPSQAKSLALTISDPDAPTGSWSHWVVYNIPPNTEEVIENTNPGTEGVNDFGKYTYGGPCPPSGKLHHYIFQAYALDIILTINAGANINDFERVILGHIIEQSQVVGTYQK